jgi:hypothetical protein
VLSHISKSRCGAPDGSTKSSGRKPSSLAADFSYFGFVRSQVPKSGPGAPGAMKCSYAKQKQQDSFRFAEIASSRVGHSHSSRKLATVYRTAPDCRIQVDSNRLVPGLKAQQFGLIFRGLKPSAPSRTAICNCCASSRRRGRRTGGWAGSGR